MTHQELVTKWPSERAVKVRDLIGKLSLCSCGDPTAAWRVILYLLQVAEDHDKWGSFSDRVEVALVGDNYLGHPPIAAPPLPWREFGAKCLDAWGLTEHGGGISSAWLTAEGDLLLDFLRDFGVEPWDMTDDSGWPGWSETFGWETPGNTVWAAYAEWAAKHE